MLKYLRMPDIIMNGTKIDQEFSLKNILNFYQFASFLLFTLLLPFLVNVGLEFRQRNGTCEQFKNCVFKNRIFSNKRFSKY